MKWIDELEKIKSPDPKPIGTDDPNSFLWGVKNHTDKTDKIPTTEKVGEVKGYPIPTDEKEFSEDERKAIQDFDGGRDDLIQRVKGLFDGEVIPERSC
jgi:hypothetical protein